MTRPEVCFRVQTLSQFLHPPKKSHMDASLRVVEYIKGNQGKVYCYILILIVKLQLL